MMTTISAKKTTLKQARREVVSLQMGTEFILNTFSSLKLGDDV